MSELSTRNARPRLQLLPICTALEEDAYEDLEEGDDVQRWNDAQGYPLACETIRNVALLSILWTCICGPYLDFYRVCFCDPKLKKSDNSLFWSWWIITSRYVSILKLVMMVGCLYLTINHIILVSLPLLTTRAPTVAYISIYHPAHISISYINLFSLS
jgi:hypothetical protein